MTAVLLIELKRLASLEINLDLKDKHKTDLFGYYKAILLRLKNEDPALFSEFMDRGHEIVKTSSKSGATKGLKIRTTAPATMVEL